MLRAIFICIFLPLYMLVAGPPLLLYTLISRNPNPLYWGGVKGILFLMRLAGVKVRTKGRERVPAGACLFVANHTSSVDAPAVVGGFRGAWRSCSRSRCTNADCGASVYAGGLHSGRPQ